MNEREADRKTRTERIRRINEREMRENHRK